MIPINEKVIVITGGAGLLGYEFAREIIANKGCVVIADINEENGLNAVEKLRLEFINCNVQYEYLNINNKESITLLIKNIHNKFGRIDALVNNAYPRNANYGRRFEEVEYIDFCENINLNLGGYFLTSQHFLKYFTIQSYGVIINISSIYGVIAPKFEIYNDTKMTMPVEYALIKSALIQFTKYLAKYYKGKNIRINSISLGGIFDNQPETFVNSYRTYCLNKGMLDSTDINGTLIFLLSDSSKFINGQNIIVDDGFTL